MRIGLNLPRWPSKDSGGGRTAIEALLQPLQEKVSRSARSNRDG